MKTRRSSGHSSKPKKRPPVVIQISDGWRQGETLTVFDTEEAALKHAEEIRRRLGRIRR